MESVDVFTPEQFKNLKPFFHKSMLYDNTYSICGIEFDGPETKMDQEVGYLDNAVDRERKRNAAAAQERYHKMTPEERYAKNQKKRHREVSDDVEIQKIQKPARNQKVSPNQATKKQNADEQMATSEPVKRPTRYQRMTFEERKVYNKKKTDAKRAKKDQMKIEENDKSYYEQLERSFGVPDEDDENEMTVDENDAFDRIVAKYK